MPFNIPLKPKVMTMRVVAIASRRSIGRAFMLAVGFCLSLWGPAALAADESDGIGTSGGPNVPFRGCIYFEHSGFSGARVEIREGTNRSYVGDAWNDRISSIACHLDCSLTAFEHRNYGGASRTFFPNIEYVGDFWNDRISSMKVSCRAPRTPPREAIGPGMEENTDRPGSDYRRFTISGRDPAKCRQACLNDRARCRAWTYVRPGVQGASAVCYLKAPAPAPTANTCCISGVVKKITGLGKKEAPWKPGPGDIATDRGGLLTDARRCKSGFVWRAARPTDYVCVPPESRDRAARENAEAPKRVDPNGAYGPNSCISGFVWREAYDGDAVCVPPEIRALVKEENRLGPSRTE